MHTFTMNVLWAIRTSHHAILWNTSVDLQTNIAELPSLPVLVTRHTKCSRVLELFVVLVFLKLKKKPKD